jgi:hypothetical protein
MNDKWRRVAGLVVIAALIGVGAMLIPSYIRNYQFQSALEDLVDRSKTPEAAQAAAVDKAGQMGLPVRAGDVHARRSGNGVKVEIVYVVRVDLPLYTVDLHFHPSASSE